MPAKSPQALARKYARRAERKTEKRQTLPFVGCDGEGTSYRGEHAYALLRIGDKELFKGGRRLLTPECLTFILQAPPRSEALLVGFAFEYDIANILRDVPMRREKEDVPSRMERLLNLDDPDRDRFSDPWTWVTFDGYPEFGLSYLPRHHLKVCYAEKYSRWRSLRTGKLFDEPQRGAVEETWRRSVAGSIRIIEDTFGLFQASFLRAIQNWDVGREHWKVIERNKAKRSSFREITPAIREYNRIECELLSRMMGDLREATIAAGIDLKDWDGAGRIATVMLKSNNMLRRKELEKRTQKGLLEMAHAAYYGGRFEITRIGQIDKPVLEVDINSAYPAGLQTVPCPLHGKWRLTAADKLQSLLSGTRSQEATFVAPVRFSHPKSTFLCGLPFRQEKSGALMWPLEGRGTYWSVELRSALKLGCRAVVEAPGWLYERACDCQPYAWLRDTYERRKALGKDRKGIPLKLGINSVYGKRAQRIGGAPWQSPIDAGLATAWTRAQINHAIHSAGARNVVMIATDAVYVADHEFDPDDPAFGDGLGQWTMTIHPRLFISQPGIYWPPKGKVKTRGISAKYFKLKVIRSFEKAWSGYMFKARKYWSGNGSKADAAASNEPAIPIVKVKTSTFVGLRLAMHRKAYDDLCRWITDDRAISFDWAQKRDRIPRVEGRSLILGVRRGDPEAISVAYTHETRPAQLGEALSELEERKLLYETMTDFVDLTPPHK
jgi:hypothetical protein